MKKIILMTCISFCSSNLAHDLPNTFEAGQPIVASEVNENFSEIESEILSLKSQMETMSSNVLPQYVGNSSGLSKGGAGIRALSGLCESTYNNSRMCTTEEYIKTINFPSEIPNINAWISPAFIGVSEDRYFFDKSTGLSQRYNAPNCVGFSSISTSFFGVTVSETGRFETGFCSDDKPVACCK